MADQRERKRIRLDPASGHALDDTILPQQFPDRARPSTDARYSEYQYEARWPDQDSGPHSAYLLQQRTIVSQKSSDVAISTASTTQEDFHQFNLEPSLFTRNDNVFKQDSSQLVCFGMFCPPLAAFISIVPIENIEIH